ncbi:histone-lysine N-methyltransferase Set8 [Bacillus rossius redtenbacheri]|uniref:histone-lysine N-methyltransferase Set8 n=1 Tax=Bacillus rossius redtenbacheri TaxID=93214 RepID=UPI002FDDDF89
MGRVKRSTRSERLKNKSLCVATENTSKGVLSNLSSNKNTITKYFDSYTSSELEEVENLQNSVPVRGKNKPASKRKLLNLESINDTLRQESLLDGKEVRTPHKIQLCDPSLEVLSSRVLSQIDVESSPKKVKQQHSSDAPHENYVGSKLDSHPKPALKVNSVSKPLSNRKVTDFFAVRRSVRKTKTTMLKEQQHSLEEAILSKQENGLEICYFQQKGRGIVATRPFIKGEFVVEYAGELIDMSEAKIREQKYSRDENTGCYMYYFQHHNVQYCVDATAETGRFGRLVNHSRNGNLVPRVVVLNDCPHLVLVAKDNIMPGKEIVYDYGDRSKESLRYHPWLAT